MGMTTVLAPGFGVFILLTVS